MDTRLSKKIQTALLMGGLICQIISTASAAAKGNKSQFHRLDFKIEGASCAACLIRLEKKFKSIEGMQKVMVSIHKPYQAVLISEAGKFKMSAVDKAIKSENARMAGLAESDLDELPIIIAPK